MGTGAASSKAKQSGGTAIATTLGLAKETGGSPTVGDNRACSNRRNRKNKCSGNKKSGKINEITKKKYLYNRHR